MKDKRKICGTGEKEVIISVARARWVLYCMQHTLKTTCGGNSNAERMAKRVAKDLTDVFPGITGDIQK